LPDVATARLRVAERVSHGGHDIPVADLERRFARSLENLFNDYASLADRTICLLNSGEAPELVFTQQGATREVGDLEVLRMLETWRQA